MYVLVKFLCDNEEVMVPTSHVKDYNPEDFQPNMEKMVFYSTVENETPEEVMDREGYIPEIRLLKPRKKSEIQQAAHYLAVLLLQAETEEQLIAVQEKKRVCKQTQKAREVPKRKGSQRLSKTENKPVKKHALMRLSDAQNLADLEVGAQKKNSDSDSQDSDNDTLTPRKSYLEEIAALRKALAGSHKKNLQLSTIIDKQREADTEASTSKGSSVSELAAPGSQSLLGSQYGAPAPSIVASHSLSATPQHSAVAHITTGAVLPRKINVFSSITDNQQVDNDNFRLTEQQVQLAAFNVRPGPFGDSVFVKNLAMQLFSEKTFMNSSISGKPSRFDKNRPPKPALCQRRVNHIRELLLDRALADRATVSPTPNERVKKVHYFIREKISTLNRVGTVTLHTRRSPQTPHEGDNLDDETQFDLVNTS